MFIVYVYVRSVNSLLFAKIPGISPCMHFISPWNIWYLSDAVLVAMNDLSQNNNNIRWSFTAFVS